MEKTTCNNLIKDDINQIEPMRDDKEEIKLADQELKRQPKKKVALLLGFRGTGYYGMQYNYDLPTIERDLFFALCKANAISRENSEDFYKNSFTRTARTDKGVHAAGNVVALKMNIEDSDIIEKVNSFLPESIRVWDYVRVNNSFDAKVQCHGRKYEYIMPTFCLSPFDVDVQEKFDSIDDKELECFIRSSDNLLENDVDGGEKLNGDSYKENIKNGFQIDSSFRISKDTLNRLQLVLKEFVGTRNFHNYTIRVPYWDRSALRTIKSFTVSDPFIKEGIEWISFHIHGQSFMLHQIRKMIGMTILLMKSSTPLSIITESYGTIRLNIPKAPALGLLLEEPLFDSYNEKVEREALTNFVGKKISFEPYREQIEAFKQKYIYEEIIDNQGATSVFSCYLEGIESHPLNFAYINSAGRIPEIYKQLANEGVYDKSRGKAPVKRWSGNCAPKKWKKSRETE